MAKATSIYLFCQHLVAALLLTKVSGVPVDHSPAPSSDNAPANVKHASAKLADCKLDFVAMLGGIESPDASHSKRWAMLHPISAHDLEVYRQNGCWLNQFMWGNVAAADRMYHEMFGVAKSQRATTHADMSAYWTSRVSEQEWRDKLTTDQELTSVFNALVAHAGLGTAGPILCTTYVNDKDGHLKLVNPVPKVEPTNAIYRYGTNAPVGLIILQSAYSPTEMLKHVHGTTLTQERLAALLPEPNHWSDITFTEWKQQHSKPTWEKNYRAHGVGRNLVQDQTDKLNFILIPRIDSPHAPVEVLLHCLALKGVYQYNVPNQNNLPRWPGVDFKAGDPCFDALLGTPVNYGVAWFLAQHKMEFGHKMVTGVRVFTLDNDANEMQYPAIMWTIQDWTKEREVEGLRRTEEADTELANSGH